MCVWVKAFAGDVEVWGIYLCVCVKCAAMKEVYFELHSKQHNSEIGMEIVKQVSARPCVCCEVFNMDVRNG